MPEGTHRQSSRTQSRRAAFCGLAAALSTALMLLGGLIPLATYAVPMLCGAVLIPVIMTFGKRDAWLVWLATAVLSLFLGADKEAAFFYLFIGSWPLIEPGFRRIRSRGVRALAKAVYFNASFALMYAVLALVLNMSAVLNEFREMGVGLFLLFWAMFNLSMFLYDRLLDPAAVLYQTRWAPKLKRLFRQ